MGMGVVLPEPLRGINPQLQTSDYCFCDALDTKFCDGVEFGVKFIFRFEVGRFAGLLDVALEGGFAVNEGGYNVAIAGFAGFDNHHITVVNFGIDHAFTAHLKGEALATTVKAGALDIDLQASDFTAGFDAIGITGGNGAINGDIDHFAGILGDCLRLLVSGAVDTESARLASDALDRSFFLEGAEMPHDRIGALKLELLLDFPDAGPVAVAPFVLADEF